MGEERPAWKDFCVEEEFTQSVRGPWLSKLGIFPHLIGLMTGHFQKAQEKSKGFPSLLI